MMLKKLLVFVMVIAMFALPSFAATVGDSVFVGGMAFGIKFYTDGVLICGISVVDSKDGNISPGEIADLRKGDIITEIDSTKISGVGDILNILRTSEGKPMNIRFMRNNKCMDTTITPIKSKSESSYKLGLWLKDGTSGIGTVTYIENNGNFAGLGHGVCDNDSGELLKLRDADITDVTITGIKRSINGEPGHLNGVFANETGKVFSNTVQGVFGKLDTIPEYKTEAVISSKSDVTEGPAKILCTLDNNIICQYDIKIEKINHNDSNTKNFIIKVTDEVLMQKTGGIVQGMSGSPIVQGNKLVGAVTHVCVNL